MAATSEHMTVSAAATLKAPVGIVDGSRLVVRAMQRLVGAGLVLAAIGLWLAPGANNAEDLLLLKLALSVMAGLAGLALLQLSVKQPGVKQRAPQRRS